MDPLKAAKDINDQLEKRILEFFGSVEAFEQFAYLYVIEVTPPTLKRKDTNSLNVTYSIEQEVRIRPKTDEEFKEEEDNGGVV